MIEILQGTPHWVYVVFSVILYFSIVSCFSGRRQIKYLIRIPIIITLFSIILVSYFNGANALALAGWLGGVIIASAISYYFTKLYNLSFTRDGDYVILPGSPIIMIVLFSVFALKYWFGYASAIGADWTKQSTFPILDSMITGGVSGFFVGRGYALFIATTRLGKIIRQQE